MVISQLASRCLHVFLALIHKTVVRHPLVTGAFIVLQNINHKIVTRLNNVHNSHPPSLCKRVVLAQNLLLGEVFHNLFTHPQGSAKVLASVEIWPVHRPTARSAM